MKDILNRYLRQRTWSNYEALLRAIVNRLEAHPAEATPVEDEAATETDELKAARAANLVLEGIITRTKEIFGIPPTDSLEDAARRCVEIVEVLGLPRGDVYGALLEVKNLMRSFNDIATVVGVNGAIFVDVVDAVRRYVKTIDAISTAVGVGGPGVVDAVRRVVGDRDRLEGQFDNVTAELARVREVLGATSETTLEAAERARGLERGEFVLIKKAHRDALEADRLKLLRLTERVEELLGEM